jgi:hypothetical protein
VKVRHIKYKRLKLGGSKAYGLCVTKSPLYGKLHKIRQNLRHKAYTHWRNVSSIQVKGKAVSVLS